MSFIAAGGDIRPSWPLKQLAELVPAGEFTVVTKPSMTSGAPNRLCGVKRAREPSTGCSDRAAGFGPEGPYGSWSGLRLRRLPLTAWAEERRSVHEVLPDDRRSASMTRSVSLAVCV